MLVGRVIVPDCDNLPRFQGEHYTGAFGVSDSNAPLVRVVFVVNLENLALRDGGFRLVQREGAIGGFVVEVGFTRPDATRLEVSNETVNEGGFDGFELLAVFLAHW